MADSMEYAASEGALASSRPEARAAGGRMDLPLPASSRPPPAWAVLAAVAGLAAALPLWSSRLLPFQDAPQHLATIRVLADYRDPLLRFDQWFEIDLRRLEYLGFYLPAAGLAKLVGPDAACRLVLSAVALALPAAAWFFLGVFGRDRRLAVLAPAVFHTSTLYLGFFNFVESVPAMLAVVALAEREIRDPRAGRALLLALAGPALLWLHPSALALAIGAAVFLAATSGRPARWMARALAPFLPGLALLGVWAVRAVANRDGVQAHPHTAPSWLGPKEQLMELLRSGDVIKGHADELVVAGLVLLWAAAALVPGRPRAPRAWRLPALALVLLAVYMVTPFDMGQMGYIYLRAVPLLALAAIASPLVAPGRVTGAILATAVVLQLSYGLKLAGVYRAFDREAEISRLDEVLGSAAPGKRLVALIYDQKSRLVLYRSYLHFAAYYELERGGRARMNFAEYPWTPVRYRRDREPLPLPRNWEAHPLWYDPACEGADADYVLTRGEGPAPGPGFRLAARSGGWALYARKLPASS